MAKFTFGCLVGIFMLFVYVATVPAEENEFIFQGDGRAADITSFEKNVSPDQDLVITITGSSRYQMQSQGKFSVYKEKRHKIKEVRFALQPGEAKSWEFPAKEKIQLVGLGVYGKGEIKVILQQGALNAAKVAAEKGPAITNQVPSESVAAAQSSETVSGSLPLLLKEAEKSYLSGNKLEAVEKLKQAILNIWNEVPLTIKNVRLVEDTKTYVTRKSNTFGSGEKIHVNAQIYGYELKRFGGAYSINISTDVYFLQGGEILAGQQNFGKFDLISPMPNTEFRLDLTYWLTDAPAGIYDVQTVVHDQNSGQSTKFITQIEMR
jgi:hypothetical protein